MTPLHRSVPQRRRRNLWPLFDDSLVAALVIGVLAMPLVCFTFTRAHEPSRLQPALDQIQRDIEQEQRNLDQVQRFGERKCWSGEVGR